MTVIITQHMVGDNCRSESLSTPTSAILEVHAPLYQLQRGCYVQLRSWA